MKKPFKVGDLVTTDYRRGEETIVRCVTSIERGDKYGSGFVASVDGGGVCFHCGRALASPIYNVDANWFTPVAKGT